VAPITAPGMDTVPSRLNSVAPRGPRVTQTAWTPTSSSSQGTSDGRPSRVASAAASASFIFTTLAADYQSKRDLLLGILERQGFTCYKPAGAYYLMADVSRFGFDNDADFAQYLIRDIGVATIPGSSFYIDPSAAPQTVRFCFSKRDETLHEAGRRLARLPVSASDRA